MTASTSSNETVNAATSINHRRVVAIALPLTLAYLTTPIVGAADTTVIGRLGDAALLGGIAVGAIFFDILFTTFNFLRAGTTGLTAQALGAGDKTREAAILLRALMISVGAGAIMIAGQALFVWAALALIGPEGKVKEAAETYIAVRLLSAPFALANYSLLGWFIGLSRSTTALVLQTILNGVNIAATLFFVNVMDMGVAGAAIGSVIGEAFATLIGLALAAGILKKTPLPNWTRLIDRAALLRLFAVNRDIMIRSFTLVFAFAFFTSQGTALGEVTLAANAVLMTFFIFGGYFLDGFAAAAEQLVGQAVGSKSRRTYDRAVKLTAIWSFILGGGTTLILLAVGPVLIDFMTTAPEVRETAREFLIWAALTPLVGALAFQMDGIFIGATWTEDMRNMMLASLALYLLVWWIAMPILENHGLWFALLVFLSARGGLLLLRSRVRASRTFS